MGATALALGGVLVTAPLATASGGGDTQRVRLRDDCEPVSFNAVLGAEACVGDGDTTFAELMAQLADNGMEANESADHWEFQPGEFHIDEGDRLRIVNIGGEFHSFTEVEEFGGGCIEDLNKVLGVHDMVDECENFFPLMDTTGVAAGETKDMPALDVGTHKFECLIHPWMQSVVTVRADDDADDDDDDHRHHH